MAAGRLAVRDKRLLELLAVGTFGGQDIWRPGYLAARTFGGYSRSPENGTFGGQGQRAVGPFGG